MWPLVAWLLLYPIALRLSDWLVALAGREAAAGDARSDLVLYLGVAAVLLALFLLTHPILP